MFGLFKWIPRNLLFSLFTFAVVNKTSFEITNRDATPQLLTDPGPYGSFRAAKWGQVLTVTGDSINSTYRFFTLPSNAIIDQLILWCAAQGAACTFDFGLYNTTLNGGLAVSGDTALFASALDVSSAVGGVDLRFTSGGGALAITTAGQPLWQLAGLSADPSQYYDIVIHVSAAVASGAAVVLKVVYGR
jgi:hypothetical protein